MYLRTCEERTGGAETGGRKRAGRERAGRQRAQWEQPQSSTTAGKQCWLWDVWLQTNCDRIFSAVNTK